MLICHISDTHGAKFHSKLKIPACDVLIHSGDIGGRTTNLELAEFLIWFDQQPAKQKIWIAGNHDLLLDTEWVERQKNKNVVTGLIAQQQYEEGQKLINSFNSIYLFNSSFEYEGIKFWGSPYTPSFHRQHWAFNADRGDEIAQYWEIIPNDIDVLIVHGAPYGILDKTMEWEHKGCKDLLNKVKQIQPSLFLCGHIHEDFGHKVVGKTTFVNGSNLNHNYELTHEPVLIEINVINDGLKEVKIIN